MFTGRLLRIVIFGLLTAALTDSPALVGAEPVTYRTHIRRIFRDHCVSCHRGNRPKAGLDLSSYAGALKGSASGTVAFAGEPDESLLYRTVAQLEEPVMPPGRDRLDDEAVKAIRQWIQLGMPERPADVVATRSDPSAETASPASVEDTAAESGESKMSMAAETPPAEAASVVPRELSVSPVFLGARATPVTSLAVSPSGAWAAVGRQLQILIFDLPSSQLIGVLPFPEGEVFSLKFRADGKQLIAGGGTVGESGRVVVWDLPLGTRMRELGDEYDSVLACDISPDGGTVVLGGPERLVKVYDVATAQLRATIRNHTDWLLQASFSPEGLIFASADRAGNLFVWETDSAEPLHSLRGHRGSVTAIEWSADGDQCYSAGEDGTVRVWDLHTGQQLRQWTAHESGVLTADMSVTGELITAGRDHHVRMWSADGQQQQEFSVDALPLQVQAAGRSEVLLGDWSGRVRQRPMDDRGRMSELSVPEELQTTKLADIDQTVASPSVPEIPAMADAERPPASPVPPPTASNEEADESGLNGVAKRLRLAAAALPDSIAALRAAEQLVKDRQHGLAEARERLETAREQAAVDSANQSPLTVDERLQLRERMAALAALVAALKSARELADAAAPHDAASADAALLTRVALEKAQQALQAVDARRQDSTEQRSAAQPTAAAGSMSGGSSAMVDQSAARLTKAEQDLVEARETVAKARSTLNRLNQTIREMTAELDRMLDAASDPELVRQDASQPLTDAAPARSVD